MTEEKKDDILQVIRYYKNSLKDKEVPNELVIKVKKIIDLILEDRYYDSS